MFRTKTIVLLTAFTLFTEAAKAQTTPRFATVHIGFIPPVSTNGNLAREYTNGLSLHAIGGISYGEAMFCASGLSSYVYNNANGVMMAGLSNHVRNEMSGVQAAGLINTVRNNTYGLQLAGLFNLAGSIHGGQFAGLGNVSFENSRGIQASGLLNLAVKDIKGFQIAGFINMAGNVNGTQAAGFINQSKDVNTQLAGFINIARKVKGIQLAGFINIADSSDYPIAPINIIRNGQKSLGVTLYDGNTTMLTFRSGGRVMYGVTGIGYHQKPSSTPLFSTEAGIGAHLRVTKNLRINVEGSGTNYTNFSNRIYLKSSLRIMPALSIGKRLEIFAGPSFNHVQGDDDNFNEINRNYLWSTYAWGNFNGLYLGFTGGMHYHL